MPRNPMAVEINRADGSFRVNGNLITKEMTIADLSDSFEIGDTQPVSVVGRTVNCTFAKANCREGNLRIGVDLRFEEGCHVSSFFSISDDESRYETAEAFYASGKKRKEIHHEWIASKIGYRLSSPGSFAWGSIGVAVDKSDEVYVYIHNANNKWA